MKYVFDKNGIDNSENTERLVQYSVNANILQVAFTDLNIKEYVPYVAFERADGKVSPLIGMAFTEFELSGTKYSGASYSFSDSWVTAQSGILKVAVILKKNNVNARTSTFNLNVAESISEDKVNYIEDVAYNELVGRVYQLEKKQQDIINGDLSVGVADKAHSDYFGHEFTEHYETKIGANEKVNELKRKVENGEVVGYSSHRDGVGNNIVATYERKKDAINKLNEAKQYANSIKPTKLSQLENDSDYVSSTVNNLVNYYLKSETFTKDEVLNLVNSLPKFSVLPVDLLPTENISNTTIYLLSNSNDDEDNYYEEYIYVSNRWELIGTTKVDLSDYAKISQLPTKTSDLTNDSGFIDNTINNLVNYYLKSDTLSRQEILNLFNTILGGYFIDENQATTGMLDGFWKFNKIYTDELFLETFNEVDFIDSLGNSFTYFSTVEGDIRGDSIYGLNIFDDSVTEKKLIYNPYTKTGLAFNEDGTLNTEYSLKFENGAYNVRVILLKVADKYIYKQFATEEYVDKAISNINGNADLSEYAKKSELPTKLSELSNDINFITNTVNNLTNYYSKSETFTQDEVRALISSITSLSMQIVDVLPTQNISSNTIYLLPKTDSGDSDVYDEYVYINNRWELIGNTKINLNEYAKKSELFSGSYNDLRDKPTIPSIAGLATEEYVDNKVSDKQDRTVYIELEGKPSEITLDENFSRELLDVINSGKIENSSIKIKDFNNGLIYIPLERYSIKNDICYVVWESDIYYLEFTLWFNDNVIEEYEGALVLKNDYTNAQIDNLLNDKADKTKIPAKVSQLENDSNYINQYDLKPLIERISALENSSGGVLNQVYAYEENGNKYEVYGYDENGNKYLVIYEEVE